MKTKTLVLIGVLIIALAAMPVMAGTEDSTTITGNTKEAIDISVTSGGTITYGANLDPSANGGDYTLGTPTLTIMTNKLDGWKLYVKDNSDDSKPPSHVGQMVESSGGTYVASPRNLSFNVSASGSTSGTLYTGSAVAKLDEKNQAVYTGGTTGYGTLTGVPVAITQHVGYGDAVLTGGNLYKIKITIVGSLT